MFIDTESDKGKIEGGNGKSVTMRSLIHFKDTTPIDGKKLCFDKNGGGRFMYSNVNHETQFILISDIEEDFKFERFFNDVTDDMVIEGKVLIKLLFLLRLNRR